MSYANQQIFNTTLSDYFYINPDSGIIYLTKSLVNFGFSSLNQIQVTKVVCNKVGNFTFKLLNVNLHFVFFKRMKFDIFFKRIKLDIFFKDQFKNKTSTLSDHCESNGSASDPREDRYLDCGGQCSERPVPTSLPKHALWCVHYRQSGSQHHHLHRLRCGCRPAGK